jgi:hypothetical protein
MTPGDERDDRTGSRAVNHRDGNREPRVGPGGHRDSAGRRRPALRGDGADGEARRVVTLS